MFNTVSLPPEVENGFTSLPSIAEHFFPVLSFFRWAIADVWDNVAAVSTLPSETHILMLSSGEDEIVPPAMMAQLRETAEQSGKQVTFHYYEDGKHMNLPLRGAYYRDIVAFLTTCGIAH